MRRTAEAAALQRLKVHSLVLAGFSSKEAAYMLGYSQTYTCQVIKSLGFSPLYVSATERAALIKQRQS